MNEQEKICTVVLESGSHADAAPVWAAEQNQSAADVVANQTMTIGGKEQIVSQKALEQARKAQEESGKSFPKKGKDGKYTYYMHNNPSEDISDPNYKSDGTKNPAAGL